MSGLDTYLTDNGIVSKDDMAMLRRRAGDNGEDWLPALFQVSRQESSGSAALVKAIAAFYDVPVASQDDWPDSTGIAADLSIAFMRSHRIFPLRVQGESGDDAARSSSTEFPLAMADPGDLRARHAVALATDKTVVPFAADANDIAAALERLTRHQETLIHDTVSDRPDKTNDGAKGNRRGEGPGQTGAPAASTDDIEHLRDLALGTPVISIVNKLLLDALAARATDIHVEPGDGRLRIRIRTDGQLRDLRPPDYKFAKAILSRIKIIAGLNIAERRLPQDGRIRIRLDGRPVDLRVAIMPTIHGEAAAIRLLDNVRRLPDPDLLGFSSENCLHLQNANALPHGLVVVTGPTGSGKTTTLAAMLSELNTQQRKILTIEDPVEYEFDGINQTQVKPSIGLTFAHTLRSVLRHDPDVIMIGEMRDSETARIGVHAALTGHLVLTTLHTNSAAAAIPRLLDMGVDSYLLASSLRYVVAQRLVRLLCPHCRSQQASPPDLPPDVQSVLGAVAARQGNAAMPPLWHATGCARCHDSGYSDRTVISEVLRVDECISALIHRQAAAPKIEAAARKNAMTNMLEDGMAKCLSGLTTTDEVMRVARGV